MKSHPVAAGLFFALHVFGCVAVTMAGPETLLPPAAAAAIAANFPKAKVTRVGRERERGAWYNEVNLRQGTSRFEVEVSDDGVIGEIEARIKLDDLPAELLRALRRYIVGGRVISVEKHERRGIARSGRFVPLQHPRIMYEVKFQTPSGDRREVQLASNEIIELPPAVRASILSMYPQARILEVEAEDDDGGMIFAVEMVSASGSFSVGVTRDGTILEQEYPVGLGSVPPAIIVALNRRQKLRPTDSVRVLRRETFAAVESGSVVPQRGVFYDLVITRGGLTRHCRFDSRGRLLEESGWQRAGDKDDDDDD